ncbi:hypothetical protein DM860_009136 [Cuscuta australis]|uniref:CBS domain-containing protein n=1 Tax=Cuscuta australis TaxID=267555 RepID=A0A328D914_9ASTE|nr:hypothetical protein DM860_009136 [Cuscuta australis]
MASVFLYHVIGDLTVGKPELAEFAETETVESAIKAIGESTECGIPVWRKKSAAAAAERAEVRQQRFVGILNSLDIVGFLCREECLADRAMAMKTPVAEVVVPNNSLLKELDPATRLIDALEMMRHGVKRLLVPKVVVWRGMSKRFSILYNGRWLKNIPTSPNPNQSSSSSSSSNRFCCLSREDVIRFVIGCLGALAPLPLSSVSALGAINPNYHSLDASRPAVDAATLAAALDPCAVAVVEPTADGHSKIAGEISATKLWKCDYSAASWALANLSAGQFVMGVEDDNAASSRSLPDFASANPPVLGSTSRMRKFSSRSIGFFDDNNINKNSNPAASLGVARSMYRGRSAPLTCRATSSLAAVMAQMLSHRATHVWVTEAENEERLVGVIGYADVLAAVTRAPPPTGFITVVPEKQAF